MNQFDVSGPSTARRPEGGVPGRGISVRHLMMNETNGDRRPQEAEPDETIYVSPPPAPWPRVFPGL